MPYQFTYKPNTFSSQIRPENTVVFISNSSGKEKDPETGYHYFGARYYNSDLSLWLSVDPMSDKYPNLSPYNYCAWNPMKLADPDGMEINPIYDLSGNFLGTDDRGIAGSAIIMDKKNFRQGMSHSEALSNNVGKDGFISNDAEKKYMNHYSRLIDRPDYDGFITISEGIKWAKEHPNAMAYPSPNNTLYLNAELLDLGFLSIENSGLEVGGDFKNVNLYDFVNPKSIRSINTTYALGNTSMKLLDNNGNVSFKGDEYNWDYHKNSPLRNALVFTERVRTGVSNNHGFKIEIYGTSKINKK